MKRGIVGVVAATLLLTAMVASAGPLDLSWWTIDGGGGQSIGGPYALVGTIGQAETDVMSGGDFVLSGGFWAGMEPRWEVFAPVIHR